MKTDHKGKFWLELILPVLASVYGIYAITEQYLTGARYSSISYTALLAAPILVCGTVIVVKKVRKAGADGSDTSADDTEPAGPTHFKRLGLFFAGMVATVALLEILGYIVAFFLFLTIAFRGLGARSPKVILLLTIGALVFIYLVFGLWLGLDLPMGIWPKLFSP
jgi:hypothetical protein